MQDNGIRLGAELYMLWRAGRDDLPAVAEVFRAADGDLRRAGHQERAWAALQYELGAILVRTAGTLEDTGRALRRVVVDYAQADAVAAGELARLKRVSGDPVPHGLVRER